MVGKKLRLLYDVEDLLEKIIWQPKEISQNLTLSN